MDTLHGGPPCGRSPAPFFSPAPSLGAAPVFDRSARSSAFLPEATTEDRPAGVAGRMVLNGRGGCVSRIFSCTSGAGAFHAATRPTVWGPTPYEKGAARTPLPFHAIGADRAAR
ncbi:unnamed protein product [[Actinomadura] parvosata subsp. kistnae]|nr:unnamed protein product [Actinomadura parvosata subsp. kistnae]